MWRVRVGCTAMLVRLTVGVVVAGCERARPLLLPPQALTAWKAISIASLLHAVVATGVTIVSQERPIAFSDSAGILQPLAAYALARAYSSYFATLSAFVTDVISFAYFTIAVWHPVLSFSWAP